jgi:hypothetical protein
MLNLTRERHTNQLDKELSRTQGKLFSIQDQGSIFWYKSPISALFHDMSCHSLFCAFLFPLLHIQHSLYIFSFDIFSSSHLFLKVALPRAGLITHIYLTYSCTTVRISKVHIYRLTYLQTHCQHFIRWSKVILKIWTMDCSLHIKR